MKRIVILLNKETGKETPYPSVSSLVLRNYDNELGIGLGALYNALHTNKGYWENKRYKVYYKTITLDTNEWK